MATLFIRINGAKGSMITPEFVKEKFMKVFSITGCIMGVEIHPSMYCYDGQRGYTAYTIYVHMECTTEASMWFHDEVTYTKYSSHSGCDMHVSTHECVDGKDIVETQVWNCVKTDTPKPSNEERVVYDRIREFFTRQQLEKEHDGVKKEEDGVEKEEEGIEKDHDEIEKKVKQQKEAYSKEILEKEKFIQETVSLLPTHVHLTRLNELLQQTMVFTEWVLSTVVYVKTCVDKRDELFPLTECRYMDDPNPTLGSALEYDVNELEHDIKFIDHHVKTAMSGIEKIKDLHSHIQVQSTMPGQYESFH